MRVAISLSALALSMAVFTNLPGSATRGEKRATVSVLAQQAEGFPELIDPALATEPTSRTNLPWLKDQGDNHSVLLRARLSTTHQKPLCTGMPETS